MIKTEEYMSHPVVTIKGDETVGEMTRLMDGKNIGSLLVMDGQNIAGIVTERDVVRKIVAKKGNAEDTPVSKIMTKKVITVDKSASLMEIAALMKQHTMRRIVVTHENKPVGIITSRDLIDLLV